MGFHHIPKPPRIVALGGPVSAAIRAMRADEPATDYARIRELRRAIADRIEADIALLDALTPDADFERDAGDEPEGTPYGAHNATEDDEPDADSEWTATERFGAGFWPCGNDYDDAEDGGDTEGLTDDNGLGDDDGLREQFAGTRYVYAGAL
jgi:hypothetical protein